MGRYQITSVDKLDGDNRIFVTVDGTEIVIVRVDDDVYALGNICPHQYGPVAEGEIEQKIVADVPDEGERIRERYEPGEYVIRCPCHGWGFDLETGENIADPENAPGVTTFDVSVEDGEIYLEI